MKEIKPRAQLDKSLNSGERQVAPTEDGIEAGHRWRYAQATAHIEPGDMVADIGCGVGYGTSVLGRAGIAFGFDDCFEAIDYAKAHYANCRTVFDHRDIFTIDKQFDVVVAFEVLEHNPDPEKFFNLLGSITKRKIILSTPHTSIDATGYPFHYRHFTPEEIKKFMEWIGFKVIEMSTPKFANGLAVYCVAERVQ